jgi:hypothetical protein
MADVTLTVVDARRSSNGQNVTDNDTTVSSSDTYYFANNGKVIVVITNAAGSNTFTVVTQNTVDALAITDLTATITASKTFVVGPFPPSIYNDAQGRVQCTFSAAADVMPVRIG